VNALMAAGGGELDNSALATVFYRLAGLDDGTEGRSGAR
jgi:hypothetical protein